MNQKNRDLPAYPIKFNDQFGQLVILGGMTKLELVAMELLKAQYTNKDFAYTSGEEGNKFYIKWAYDQAELFCSYIEDKLQQESKIIS
jgi:hypothetical protein